MINNRAVPKLMAALAAIALTASLSSCGSDDASGSTAGGLTKLTVAVSPGAATSAPMYLAAKNGVFKKHGLDIKLTVLANGSVAIPQVLNGQTQFSMASFAPVVQAVGKGLKIQIIGAANVIPTDPATKYQGIVVRDGLDDLSKAKTFAAASTEVDPVQGYAVDKLGGSYKEMKLLAVDYPAIGDAVRQGNADAALLAEPFLSGAIKAGGAKLLSYVTPAESLSGTPGAVFIGAEKYMADHSKVTKDFMAAIQEAYKYGQDHLQEVANSVPETGLNDKVPVVALGEYQQGPLETAKVEQLVDLFKRYGVLDGAVTAADLVYQP
jgi:NitT/TauT family transport system substrate-binding protein